jgi:hypothetical protein
MADRLYAGYFTLAHRAPLGVDRVMRQQARRKTDFRRGQRWARGDHVVTWPRPKRPPERSEEFYAKLPETLSMREIRYRVRQLIAQAAYAAGCLPRLLSFKTALQALRAFEQTLRQAPGKRAHIMIAFLLGAIAQQKLPQRPGRAEPRARKRRQKKAPLMMRPRATLKAILMRKNRQMMRDAFA